MPAKWKRPSLFSQWMHEYLYHRAEAKQETDAKAEVSNDIREYVRENGIVRTDDEGNEFTGNIEYRLPEPIEVEGEKFYGMELRKQRNITFDYEAAKKLAEDRDWDPDEYGHFEFIIEPDAFYVKNQQGKLTDEELDDLLPEGDPSWSLWPLEKPE